jgi:hypothetical protein
MTLYVSHRDALNKIMSLCNKTSHYTRRTQTIHEIAMAALGLTASQRQERHTKIMMRCEKFKEDLQDGGSSIAKKALKDAIEVDISNI